MEKARTEKLTKTEHKQEQGKGKKSDTGLVGSQTDYWNLVNVEILEWSKNFLIAFLLLSFII